MAAAWNIVMLDYLFHCLNVVCENQCDSVKQ